MLDWTQRAMREAEAVRDSTAGRMALLKRTYAGHGRRLPYMRAARSFMLWQIRRGVLEPESGPRPGSPWWRAINERLLRDGYEAVLAVESGSAQVANGQARHAPRSGAPQSGPREPPATSRAVALWIDFVARPSARRWYRAHNASIVSAYLEHRDLAEAETEAERFFMNVALMRVLYAHALVAAPELALGRYRALGALLGDPRLGMAGAFLSLGRALPDLYPLNGQLERYLRQEHGVGRLLDYAVIEPRLGRLYSWSAAELGLPGLGDLLHDGLPAYCWPRERSEVWRAPPPSALTRLLTWATT